MKKWLILVLVLAIAIIALQLYRQPATPTSGLEVIAQGLEVPWSVDKLPDGRLIFTERVGDLNIIDNGNIKLIEHFDIDPAGEGGFLGLAVDPDFIDNNFIYIYYTEHIEDGTRNRVLRFTLKDDKLSDERIIIDNIPGGSRFHNGGRIKFGPDGKLYITTGDAENPSLSQDLNSLAGKILRIDKDGTIPEDNPFNTAVWTYGHRNPQGIDWQPGTDVMFSSEHGSSRNDEINIIIKGKNYGWPDTECVETSQGIENPIRCYPEFTLAPAGIAFADANTLFVAGLRSLQLRKLTLDGTKVINEEELLTEYGRIRDVVLIGDYLYITTSNKDGRNIPKENDDKILRMKIS